MPIVLVAIVFYLTRNEAKTYSSNATVYTGIATGSSIVSMEESKLDLFGSRTAFDNLINIIKSRNTIEEVAIRLFTSHMILDQPSSNIIQKQSYNDLMRIVPNEVKAMVVKGDFETTLQRFKDYKNKDYTNFIYELINFNHKNYSSKKILSRVRVSRVQSSDLVEINYEADDPGICQNTLEILIKVFIEGYSDIKVNQSDAVVRYFLGQLDVANERLNQAENELLNFNRSNSIINYYEQTKHIASEKEHFDLTYEGIKMQNAAAKSVLKVLEGKMSIRDKTKINSTDIVDLRNQLAKVNLEIALQTNQQELDDEGEAVLVTNLSKLQDQSYELQDKLRQAISEQYSIDNTAEGLPSGSILQNWLEKVVELESTKAQLEIGNEKHQEFRDLFQSYAPLGATMKRLERKIDVAEREYLSLLHSLSLAKLKQQNVELNSNLKIIAAPIFPIEAKASKRKFLLVIAFMIGFIIPAFTIIVLEFLDSNIKNTYRAESLIGLPVAAIFPLVNAVKRLDIDFVKDRGLDVIARRLILNTESIHEKPKPDVNLIFSILEGEGKTLLLSNLLHSLAEFGYKILYLAPNEAKEELSFKMLNYRVNNSFHRVDSIYDLEADWTGIVFEDYDYVFVEIPGILNNSYPIKLFRSSHHSFMVTRANRAWSKADQNSLKDILEYTGENKPQILLNGVAMEEMENVLGDLPKQRSFIRRIIKNMVRLQFFSKQKLSDKNLNNAEPKPKSEPKPKTKSNYRKLLYLIIIVVGFSGSVFVGARYIYPKFFKQKGLNQTRQSERASTKPDGQSITEGATDTNLEETNQGTPIIKIPKATPEIQIKYYLIGGTYRSAENAQKCFLQYESLGYHPQIFEDAGDIFKVAVGVYDSKEKAERVRSEFLKYAPNSDVWILVSTESN